MLVLGRRVQCERISDEPQNDSNVKRRRALPLEIDIYHDLVKSPFHVYKYQHVVE